MSELKAMYLHDLLRNLVSRVDRGQTLNLEEAHTAFQKNHATSFLNLVRTSNNSYIDSIYKELEDKLNIWFSEFTTVYDPDKFGIENNGILWAIVLISRWLEEITGEIEIP